MKDTPQPVHLITTTSVQRGRTYHAHLLRRSFRDAEGHVRQEVVANVSCLPDEIVETIRRMLRGEPPAADWTINRSLPHGHVWAAMHVLRDLGLEKIIGAHATRDRSLMIAAVIERTLSRLPLTAGLLAVETARTSLPWMLGLAGEPPSDDECQEALATLGGRRRRIENKLLSKRPRRKGTAVVYAIPVPENGRESLIALEPAEPGLGNGISPRLVLAVVCDPDGRPVGCGALDLDRTCRTELGTQLSRLRQRLGFGGLIVVGSSATLTKGVRNRLGALPGVSWIVQITRRHMRQLRDDGQLRLGDSKALTETSDNGERTVVCWDPVAAEQRQDLRERRLSATERALGAVELATSRKREPLRGKSRIEARILRALSSSGVGRFFDVVALDSGLSYTRNQSAIKRARQLDGVSVFQTSASTKTLVKEDVIAVAAFLHRWRWEFVDPAPPMSAGELTSRLLAAHLRLEIHRRLESLFEQGGSRGPSDVLADLSTLAMHAVRDGRTGAEFFLRSEPTPGQRSALELLGALGPPSGDIGPA